MRSELAKLVQHRFGRERYTAYTKKLQKQEGMDVFCDIYYKLQKQSVEELNHALTELLGSVESSVKISRNFGYITLGYLVGVLTLLGAQLMSNVFIISCTGITVAYIYKLCQFLRNKYCDRDVKLVLIYKIVLFHLLEESGMKKQEKNV